MAKQLNNKTTKLKKHVKHHTKQMLVPREANQYRPHLIRRYGILAILVAVLGLQLVYNSVTTGQVLGRESSVTISGLLDKTNAARAENGQEALSLDEKLTAAAQLKAKDMLASQYWAHESPDGTKPWKWFADVGYDYADAGENLAKNFSTSSAVVLAWLDSPSHRDNVLNDQYQDVGFAVMDGEINGQPVSLVVALYGRPATAAVQGNRTSFVTANEDVKLSLVARLGIAIQSLTPAALGSVVVLMLAAFVAVMAHAYRRKLPKSLRQSWYRHHGIYKAAGFMLVAIITLVLYSGSWQI